MIGPPKLAVPGLLANQFRGVRLWLLVHVLAFMALLRRFHTAAPRYWFVPARVVIWTAPFPRPNSASTGATINRISPTRSGLMTELVLIPVGQRVSLTMIPSRSTGVSCALTPASVVVSRPNACPA